MSVVINDNVVSQQTLKRRLPYSKTCNSRRLWTRKALQGRVVRKPVNANPGLKVNRSMYISCIETFFTAYVSCSLNLFKFKPEGQKI